MEKREYASIHALEDSYWWYRGLHELVVSVLERHRIKGVILDAGCGTGRLLQILQGRWQVEGFDQSEDAISFCRQRGLQNVRVEDLNTVRLPADRYSAITSMDVLYIRGVKDERQVLRKIFDALAKNGVLLINLAAFELLRRNHDVIVHTRSRYRRQQLEKMLEEAGFRVAWSTYRLPHLFFLLAFKKVCEKLCRHSPQSDLHAISPFLNKVLLFFHRLENTMVLRGLRIPLGSSVFVVAVKPA